MPQPHHHFSIHSDRTSCNYRCCEHAVHYFKELGEIRAINESQAIGQALTGSQVMQNLQDTDRMLHDSISYTRSLVAQLTPPVLREFGLVMALTWLADQMKQHDLSVSLKLGVSSIDLPEEQAILIFQSVRELLMNVVKHANTKQSTLAVELTEDNRFIVTVADAGQGFDPAQDLAGTDKHFGHFSIRERMEAMGGSFEIGSTPGQGTTARLVVARQSPFSSQTAPANRATSLSEAATRLSASAEIRILMVDDHPLVRQGMRGVMEGFKNMHVVGEAMDGREAVQLAETLRPDVIVMDVNMPNMDGIEATRVIRRAHPATIIIGLSVNDSPHVAAAMREAGATAYLTKEAAPEQLYHAICEALENQ
jgi:CheY-like chemotaxis protein